MSVLGTEDTPGRGEVGVEFGLSCVRFGVDIGLRCFSPGDRGHTCKRRSSRQSHRRRRQLQSHLNNFSEADREPSLACLLGFFHLGSISDYFWLCFRMSFLCVPGLDLTSLSSSKSRLWPKVTTSVWSRE